MIKEFTGTGKTIQEATINARQGLNAPLGADIQVEVVCEPKKKILGLFGGSDAKVRAFYDDGKKEKKPHQKKQNQTRNQNAQQKEQRDKKQQPREARKDAAPAKQHTQQPKREKPQAEKAAPAQKERPAITADEIDLDAACTYLKTMLNGMKVDDAEIKAEVVDGIVEMTVEASDYGIIIGRRGETLDALQYLTGLAIKNDTDKYVRVSINIGDYKEKRAETLKALAIKNANYALRYSRRYTFEPMNPYERRIIHTAVQEIEGVTSRSIGSGIDRRVVIEPEGGARHQQRPYRNDRRSNDRRPRSSAPAQSDPNREKKVDRADIPKFGKIQVNNDSNNE